MKSIKIVFILIILVSFGEFELFSIDSMELLDKNIGILKLAENTYLMKSSFALNGNLDCNHLLVIDKTDVILVNTPVNDSITKIMLTCIEHKFNRRVTRIIVSHYHDDSAGGLLEAKMRGIITYSFNLTQDKLKERQIKIDNIFTDFLTINLKENIIEMFYFGAGHSIDNIVIWMPNEKNLFGGCLLKSLSTNSKGNILDADLVQWPLTVKRVKERFNSATIVIPGHSDIGDNKIFDHTIEILKTN